MITDGLRIWDTLYIGILPAPLFSSHLTAYISRYLCMHPKENILTNPCTVTEFL
jgi:hypothetical protein